MSDISQIVNTPTIIPEGMPNQQQGTPPDVASAFDAAVKALNTEQPAEPIVKEEVVEQPKTKPEQTGELPDDVLMGKKPEAEAPKKDEVEELLGMPVKMSEANRDNWKRATSIMQTQKEEIIALKAAAEARGKAEPDTAVAEKLAAYEKQIEELTNERDRADFAGSPKVKGYNDKISAAVSGAKEYLDGTEIDPSVVDLAAAAKGPKRLKHLQDAGLSGEQIGAIMPYLRETDSLAAEKEGLLANHKEEAGRYKLAQEQRAQQQEQLLKQQEDGIWKKETERIGKEWRTRQRIDGNEAWNKGIDAREKTAYDILNGNMPYEKLVEASHAAAELPMALKIIDNLRERLNAATAKNGKLSAAQPVTDTNGAVQQASYGQDVSPNAIASRFDQQVAHLRGG